MTERTPLAQAVNHYLREGELPPRYVYAVLRDDQAEGTRAYGYYAAEELARQYHPDAQYPLITLESQHPRGGEKYIERITVVTE